MNVQLPRPAPRYDAREEAQRNALLEQALAQKFDRRERLEARQGIVLVAPDGGRWLLTVDNAGVLGTSAL